LISEFNIFKKEEKRREEKIRGESPKKGDLFFQERIWYRYVMESEKVDLNALEKCWTSFEHDLNALEKCWRSVGQVIEPIWRGRKLI
jgi:hypothetical protein